MTTRARVEEPDAGIRPSNTHMPSARMEEHDIRKRFLAHRRLDARVEKPDAGTRPCSPQTPTARVEEPGERKRFLTHLRLVPV